MKRTSTTQLYKTKDFIYVLNIFFHSCVGLASAGAGLQSRRCGFTAHVVKTNIVWSVLNKVIHRCSGSAEAARRLKPTLRVPI